VPSYLLMLTTKVSHWSSSIGNGNIPSRYYSWIGGRHAAGATGESSESCTTDARELYCESIESRWLCWTIVCFNVPVKDG
jgi:hypothetical protein